MSKKKSNLDQLKQGLNYDWPKIQRQLIGDGVGLDSWWLDRFDRKDVLFELPGIAIMNTQDWHADHASRTLRQVYDVSWGDDCEDCFESDDILAQIARFPEGQFVAIRISGPAAGAAIALTVTMRTSRPPTAPVLAWREAIGDLTLSAHDPQGEWLYGVEMAVDSSYRGHGIGTHFHKARFQLAKALNLRGIYAVGMLMGYRDYADKMDVVEYGNKVMQSEIKDPTVTMQMNRGFRADGVVRDYVDESAASNAGVLIVWDNPDYVGAAT